jgi:hypothetical protein
MTRVLVCGGRDFNDVPLIWKTLDLLCAVKRFQHVIDGASDDVTGPYVGADYWAHQWAVARDMGTTRFLADWARLRKAAGPIRNKQMLTEGMPKLVVAFPGGKGTANMVAQARAAGIEVIEVS